MILQLALVYQRGEHSCTSKCQNMKVSRPDVSRTYTDFNSFEVGTVLTLWRFERSSNGSHCLLLFDTELLLLFFTVNLTRSRAATCLG